MRRLPLLLALCACAPEPTDEVPDEIAVDLVSPLPSGEARAGVVTDVGALWGGVFAEGQPGDVKIYNDRVRFVIQGVRPGSYIVPQGGGVLDADIVRPAGQAGHDLVKDWHGLVGIGRVVDPEQVEVVEDGSEGGAAVVRVRGPGSAMGFLSGNLETPDLIPDLDIVVEHVYTLPPDSWTMTVKTTVTAGTLPVDQAFGDLLMGSPEVAWRWGEGGGLDGPSGPFRWTGYVGQAHEAAVAVLTAPGETMSSGGFEIIAQATDVAGGFGAPLLLAPGASASWTRSYGVAPDLATLTNAWLAASEEPTEALTGTVTASDGPVAGAWVVAYVDDAPFTLAVTDATGGYSIAVPAGADARVLAVGRSTGLFLDLPEGAGPSAPYAHPEVASQQRLTLAGGAPSVPLAEGRGVASAEAPLTLGVPAQLEVSVADGLPFTVRVLRTEADAPTDDRVVPRRPEGLAGAAWSRDGGVSLLVEPGTYDVVVHRGLRYELSSQRVTLAAGENAPVQAELDLAYTTPGWLLTDPHSHAVSSGDASIAMEDRVIVAAALGLQVHIGTDHDRISDYRPLVSALGLSSVLSSVVAEEFSPTLRGHFNVYPIDPNPSEPDLGSWRWWAVDPLPSTDEMLAFLRGRHGDLVIQSNHPTDQGLAANAGWRPGEVRNAFRWTTGFEAIEVLNGGSSDDYLPFWWDLATRGVLTAPVGVSDSHNHFGGMVGLSATFVQLGQDDVADLDPQALVPALRDRKVVVTRGPFLRTTPAPSTVVAPAEIEVEALSPSWIVIDRLRLVCNGEEVEVQEGAAATFTVSPEQDAVCVVMAEGDQPMQPVSSRTPWAMTAPWLVDVGGNGWEPPLPSLVVR